MPASFRGANVAGGYVQWQEGVTPVEGAVLFTWSTPLRRRSTRTGGTRGVVAPSPYGTIASLTVGADPVDI